VKFYENKVADIRIAYIGGGSRGWAWGLMKDLALEEQLSGEVRLYDIDMKAAYDNVQIGNRFSNCNDAKSHWIFNAFDNLEEALDGADFVVISILPGTLKEMESDVHTPEKYGIYQSVGDTTGPGGIIRSLRTIPMYVEFAEGIKKKCPDAWVINYTNPMTICTRTLYKVFPGIKAFGCCHEVFGTQELFVDILKLKRGYEQIDRNDIHVNVLGINHFTWIDKVSYEGNSLMDLYNEFVEEYYEKGYREPSQDSSESVFSCGQRVKMDLYKRYGILAAAGDRHLAEFCPPWYLKNPETVAEWQFRLTPVSYRFKELDERLNRSKSLVEGKEELHLEKSSEEGVLQMKALLGLKDMVTNMNLPNRGQINGLPFDSVVETNAYITRNSITPLMAGKLPENVNMLVLRHVNNQETVLKASLSKDGELAFVAFANDPLMTASISDAKRLFDEMIKNTSKYLPDWSK
jgi:Alpha-galactosidases/6-phospho-beta-glucosidases, family 4 of glycosyl hydrolases